ncbi:TPA: hypothetical protein ACX6RC_001296 [Photobacterium damselae]
MIDISGRLTRSKIDFHLNGFFHYVSHRLFGMTERHRLNPEFAFEKKFYRALSKNRDLLNSIVLADCDALNEFEKHSFYSKHRLFFLLCMHKVARDTYPFNIHMLREYKNLPRDLSNAVSERGLDVVSKEIMDRCKLVFNYNKFTTVDKRKINDVNDWNAYNYLQGFSTKVCPYCNLDVTTLVNNCLDENRVQYKIRPALDHYLPQSLFPYFSLSIYNLIPSCTSCNSSLKGDINFKALRHINPMGQSFDNKVKFGLLLRNSDDIFSVIDDLYNTDTINIDNFKISIESQCANASRNLSTFEIVDRYNVHLTQVECFLSNLSKAKPEKLKIFMDIFDTDDELEAISKLLHFEINEDKHCDIPLSRLKKDLIDRYVYSK